MFNYQRVGGMVDIAKNQQKHAIPLFDMTAADGHNSGADTAPAPACAS